MMTNTGWADYVAACQRWRDGRHSWRPANEGGFNPRNYTTVVLDEPAARRFVETHHYSRSYPADRLRVGLVEGGRLVGVAVLGVPMQAAVLTGPFPTLVPYTQSLELSRLVLLDEVPANAESWFVARVFAYAASLGVRGVVAFSDPLPRHVAGQVLMPGHIGTVYKALNAHYTGRGTPRTLTILPNGQVFSARTRAKVTGLERGWAGAVGDLVALGAPWPGRPVPDMDRASRSAWLADALTAVGARTVRHHGNHRYVWTTGTPAARRRTPIGLDTYPYPTTVDVVTL